MAAIRLVVVLAVCSSFISPVTASAAKSQKSHPSPAKVHVQPFQSFYGPELWLGGSGNWSDPQQWSAGVPDSSSHVVINTGADSVNFDMSDQIASLVLGGSSGYADLFTNPGFEWLLVGGPLLVGHAGSLFFQGSPMTGYPVLEVDGPVVNAGTMDFESAEFGASNLINNGAVIFGQPYLTNMTVTGMVRNGPGASISISSSSMSGSHSADFGALANAGTLDVSFHSYLAVAGGVANSGTFSTGGGFGFFNIVTVGGDFNNTGKLLLKQQWDTVSVTGELFNRGYISVAPDASLFVGPGSSQLTGYVQAAGGVLGEGIGASKFGVMSVEGGVTLDGTLDVHLLSGFRPPVGSTYDFITFYPGELSGEFANIVGAGRWNVIYDNDNGMVELVALASPEPATMILIATAVFGGALRLRKYRNQ